MWLAGRTITKKKRFISKLCTTFLKNVQPPHIFWKSSCITFRNNFCIFRHSKFQLHNVTPTFWRRLLVISRILKVWKDCQLYIWNKTFFFFKSKVNIPLLFGLFVYIVDFLFAVLMCAYLLLRRGRRNYTMQFKSGLMWQPSDVGGHMWVGFFFLNNMFDVYL